MKTIYNYSTFPLTLKNNYGIKTKIIKHSSGRLHSIATTPQLNIKYHTHRKIFSLHSNNKIIKITKTKKEMFKYKRILKNKIKKLSNKMLDKLDNKIKKLNNKKKLVKRRSLKQIGKSNRSKDSKLKAKLPGKRTSKTGKTYYERRKNRSDKNRKKRL